MFMVVSLRVGRERDIRASKTVIQNARDSIQKEAFGVSFNKDNIKNTKRNWFEMEWLRVVNCIEGFTFVPFQHKDTKED